MSECRVIHGDALAVLRSMGSASVDCAITDPPYTAAVHDGSVTGDRGGGSRRVARRLIDFDPIDPEELRLTFDELGRVCRRWVVATLAWQQAAEFERRPPAGLRFVRLGVWVKTNAQPQLTGDRPGQGWEAIAIFHKAGGPMRWNGRGRPAVWSCDIERGRDQGLHPAQKPVRLVAELVRLFTDECETVVDPYAGSGTTPLACIRAGRGCIAIEEDERYIPVIGRRLADAATPLFAEV